MSATLDVALVENISSPAWCWRPGRMHSVDIEYLAKSAGDAPVWDIAVRELQRLVRDDPRGDGLIFMPGAYEIARTVQAARDALGREFVVCLTWRIAAGLTDARWRATSGAKSSSRPTSRKLTHHRRRALGDAAAGAHLAL